MSSKNTYSKKEIHSKLLDIASKYTDIENEDYLKSGLFGYLTESMSMMIRDSALHKSMLYKESFLNTAVIPKSIYNWAKMFNINISKATPAYADIEITINKNDLNTLISIRKGSAYDKKYGIPDSDGDINMFILDRDNPIIADEYYFTLERSIKIYQKVDNNGYKSYCAEYLTTESTKTNFQTIRTPILPIFPRNDSYIIQARAYQYKTVEYSKQIPNNSILNTKIHTYNFTGQFAGLSMGYTRGSSAEIPIEVRYSNINNAETGTFCYYMLNNEDELQVTFSNAEDAFMPKSNDLLTARLYITEGTNIPSYFSGDAVYMQSDDDFKQYPIVIRFNPTEIIGGKDMPTISKIRDTIINEISSRSVIITESDLNNYFAILTSLLESINEGKVTFIKKRDDIMRRMFSAYVLLRDGLDDDGEIAPSNYVSRCVPTNTIDIDFPVASNMSKAFGTIARHKTDDLTGYVYSPTIGGMTDYYIIPFYMYISLNPVKKIKYIYNLADNQSTCNFTAVSLSGNDSYYILPNNVHVKRDINGISAADYYTVDFTFITNFDMSMYIKNLNSDSMSSNLNIRKDNAVIGTVSLTKDNNTITSVKQDSASGDIYTTTISITVKVAQTEFNFDSGSTQYIQLLTNEGSIIEIPEKVIFELDIEGLVCNNTKINLTAKGEREQSLFENLDSMLFSDIVINTSGETGSEYIKETSDGTTIAENKVIKSITIKDVPVVHASYFNDSASVNKDKFINQLFTYINVLKENIDKLETNTFFDIKFYNTCGSAHIYDSLKTNIDLDMDIYLQDEYKDNESIKSSIKSYIRRLVDESNKTGGLRISSIIAMVNNNFNDQIDHIDFRGLNDSFNQYITKISNIDESLHVPEWLNILPDSLKRIEFK